MAEPFMGELRLMSFVHPPKGWALCDGQMLPINQNQALFSLLGTTYGGNGQTTFALPDLRGRVPIHVGNGHTLGERGGRESETLTVAQLPTHHHELSASPSAGTQATPEANLLASAPNAYRPGGAPDAAVLAASSVSSTGGSQAHQNMQPFLTLSWCIALVGIFPSQN